LKTYKDYFSYSGWGLILSSLLSYAIVAVARIIGDWWAGQWSARSYPSINEKPELYPVIYFLISLIGVVFLVLRSYIYILSSTTASNRMFKEMFYNVLRRPLSFYDTTPKGVIMNRLSKDIDDCDSTIPAFFGVLINNLF
jgi:ATP-binding cassette, subfamily C (CFTR/MRP), member 1